MKAVLLAAGLGTRLRPLTDSVPKCLVSVGNRPLLDYWFDQLAGAAIGPFLINTHHLPAAIEKHVSASRYASQATLVHEPRLLGTGGTLLANRAFFGREPVLLAHADNLCLCDFRAFVRAHRMRPPGTVLTMMTFVTDRPETCGIVDLDQRGVVIGFHEKVDDPPGNLANGAVYIVEPEVLDFLASLEKDTIDFSTEVIPHFIGRTTTWINVGVHHDIGTPRGLAAANEAVALWKADRASASV